MASGDLVDQRLHSFVERLVGQLVDQRGPLSMLRYGLVLGGESLGKWRGRRSDPGRWTLSFGLLAGGEVGTGKR